MTKIRHIRAKSSMSRDTASRSAKCVGVTSLDRFSGGFLLVLHPVPIAFAEGS